MKNLNTFTEAEIQWAKEIAETMLQQIVTVIGMSAFWSWGPHRFGVTYVYENMPAAFFKVQGLLFEGWVTVIYDEGADLYNVELRTEKEGRFPIQKSIEGIAFDELGPWLDAHIEKDTALSDDEYFTAAMADSDRRVSEACSHVG